MGGSFGEHGLDEDGEGGRGFGLPLEDGREGVGEVLHDELVDGGRIVGYGAGDEMVEGGAEGVDVAAGVGGEAEEEFGREILGCAGDFVFAGCGAGGLAGESEVGELGVSGGVEHDVVGLDVAVEHLPFGVGVLESGDDFGGDFERLLWGELVLLFEEGLDGGAVDVLHGEVPEVAVAVDGVGLDDVGVVDECGGSGLADEAVDVGGVGVGGGGDDLEGDVPVEGELVCEVDGAHAALSEFADDDEFAEDGSWSGGGAGEGDGGEALVALDEFAGLSVLEFEDGVALRALEAHRKGLPCGCVVAEARRFVRRIVFVVLYYCKGRFAMSLAEGKRPWLLAFAGFSVVCRGTEETRR